MARTRKKAPSKAPPVEQRGLGMVIPDLDPSNNTPASVVKIPIALIDIPIPNHATDRDVVDGIAQTARTDGIHVPIEVRQCGTRYELIDGRHRVTAASALGFKTIPGIVRSDLDETSTRLARVVLNTQRRRVSPYEEAVGYSDLVNELGCSLDEVAQRCGVSVTTVKSRLDLLRLPIGLAQQAGESLPVGHALALIKLVDGSPERAAAVIEELQQEDVTTWDLEYFIDEITCRLEKRGLLVRLDDPRHYTILNHPKTRKSFEAVPRVKVGPRSKRAKPVEIVMDVDAWATVAKAAKKLIAMERREQRAARDPGSVKKPVSEEEQLIEQRLDEEVQRVEIELLARAVGSIVFMDKRVARTLINACRAYQYDPGLVTQILGEPIPNHGKPLERLLELPDWEARVIRILMAAALALLLDDAENERDKVLQTWIGSTGAKLRRAARPGVAKQVAQELADKSGPGKGPSHEEE